MLITSVLSINHLHHLVVCKEFWLQQAKQTSNLILQILLLTVHSIKLLNFKFCLTLLTLKTLILLYTDYLLMEFQLHGVQLQFYTSCLLRLLFWLLLLQLELLLVLPELPLWTTLCMELEIQLEFNLIGLHFQLLLQLVSTWALLKLH